MPTITQLKPSSAENFDALPETIKDWMASDQVTVYISEINKKLGLKGEKRRIIPQLVIRLVLKDLEPADFINELGAALNMNNQAAKALAQELEEKIFNPIALGLKRDVGLDVKLIYFGKPSERGPVKLGEMPLETPQIEALPRSPQATGIPAESLGTQPFTQPFAAARRPAPAMPVSPRTPEPEEPEIGKAPALIYKKGTFGRIPIAESKPAQPAPPPLPTSPAGSPAEARPRESMAPPRPPQTPFDIPKQVTSPETKLKVEAPPLRPTAPLEINRPVPKPEWPGKPATSSPLSGSSPFPKATKIVNYFQAPAFNPQPEIRVVHYSNFLTPLDELGLEKKQEPKKEDVILNGNIVDLRFLNP